MTPDDPRHATRAGYYAHRRDNETACAQCKRAAATYEAQRDLARLEERLPAFAPHQVTRRVQALIALGWTQAQIGGHAGIHRGYIQYLERSAMGHIHALTFHKVSATYEALCMKIAPDSYGATRARARAKRRGYVPPLAWDDIDDIDERPTGATNYRPTPKQPTTSARCGTDSGYYRHRRSKKEPACQACLDAHRDYERARSAAA